MAYLFVYGTLMKDRSNHDYLSGEKYIGAGLIKGYAMYDLGFSPGIIPMPGEKVRGEIYYVSRHTLELVDILEGSGNMYKRVTIKADVSDGTVLESYAYVWNGVVCESRRVGFNNQPWAAKY